MAFSFRAMEWELGEEEEFTDMEDHEWPDWFAEDNPGVIDFLVHDYKWRFFEGDPIFEARWD